MKADLMKVVDALIADDPQAAQDAFHSYVVQRSSSLLQPQAEDVVIPTDDAETK